MILPRRLPLRLGVAALILATGCSAAPASAVPRGAPLPQDGALSVYVAVKARWDRYDSDAPGVREIPTDVFSYGLGDTPTWESLDAHVLSLSPAPTDPSWYRFSPIDDRFRLIVEVADARGRLGYLTVHNAETHEYLGSFRASAVGRSVGGRLDLPWRRAIYRIDGFTDRGAHLFRLAATDGRPDGIRYFAVRGYFEPKRPEAFLWRHCPLGHEERGQVGNPYNTRGLIAYGSGPRYSQVCCVARLANASQTREAVYPPGTFWDLDRLHGAGGWSSAIGVPVDDTEPGRNSGFLPDDPFVMEKALSRPVLPAYSSGTVHWCVRLSGVHTALYTVPYTIAKHRGLVDRLRSAVRSVAAGVASEPWSFGYETRNAFARWLATKEGARSGLRIEMISLEMDATVVEAKETYVSVDDVAPMTEDVRIHLAHDAPVSGAAARVTVNWERTWCDDAIPATKEPVTVRVGPPKFVAVVRLPLGHSWKMTPAFDLPGLYDVAPFSLAGVWTPGNPDVTIVPQLNGVASWTITMDDRDPTRSGPADITIADERGKVISSGHTVLNAAGKHVFMVAGGRPVAAGVYRITATRTEPGATKPRYRTVADYLIGPYATDFDSIVTLPERND